VVRFAALADRRNDQRQSGAKFDSWSLLHHRRLRLPHPQTERPEPQPVRRHYLPQQEIGTRR